MRTRVILLSNVDLFSLNTAGMNASFVYVLRPFLSYFLFGWFLGSVSVCDFWCHHDNKTITLTRPRSPLLFVLTSLSSFCLFSGFCFSPV